MRLRRMTVEGSSGMSDKGTKALRFALICRPPAADDIFPHRGKDLI